MKDEDEIVVISSSISRFVNSLKDTKIAVDLASDYAQSFSYVMANASRVPTQEGTVEDLLGIEQGTTDVLALFDELACAGGDDVRFVRQERIAHHVIKHIAFDRLSYDSDVWVVSIVGELPTIGKIVFRDRVGYYFERNLGGTYYADTYDLVIISRFIDLLDNGEI